MAEPAVELYFTAFVALYFGALAVVALWEAAAPRRPLTRSLRVRWFGNFSLAGLNTALLHLLLPGFTVSAALLAHAGGWGLFNTVAAAPLVAIVASLAFLDLSRYALHRCLHRVPWLWRLHRMHHTDQDYDFTTGLRFHPFETALTAAVSFAVIAALGPPVAAIVGYELVLVVVAVFAHANVRLPLGIDRWLRLVVFTPDLHRVHHSAIVAESDSNFGGVTPLWDRLFGTYVDQPSLGHARMTIGVRGYEDPRHLRLDRMLLDPFTAEARLSGAADAPAPPAATRLSAGRR